MSDRSSDIDSGNRLLSQSLAYFGAITASVTHELNNVLGTIDQVSGLLEDLAFGAAQSGDELPGRLETLSGRVNKQTARGIELIKRLNAYAHTTDHALVEFDLVEVIGNLNQLMQRLAGLKKAELKLNAPEAAILVTASPFLLSQAVYLSVRRNLAVAESDDVVTISLSETDGEAVITIDAPNHGELTEPLPEPHLLTQFAGELEEKAENGRIKIRLAFPLKGES